MDDFLTQTQNVAVSQLAHPTVDGDVHARMVSLIESGDCYDIRQDQRQVEIGRHPECHIHVKDKRVSSKHLRIYRDEAFHYFIEEMSANGAWCNDHHMTKGDTRALQHGDAISVLVHHDGRMPGHKPFAAWIFRLAGHQSDPQQQGGESSAAAALTTPSRRAGGPVATSLETPLKKQLSSHLVTEQWVGENWDMRNVLGSGNFSEVRLGVQVKRAGSEKCAVKVIDKRRFLQFQSKRESQLSLQSEAEMLMGLDNPGIIRFFEWFETEDKLFIAMEFLAGGDLLQYILDHGNFSEGVARRLFGDISGAVQYLHGKNVVHRDLKPENILLSCKDVAKMVPKLADFGLARMNMKTKDCKTFCGTPHYFAPEVINTFRERDAGFDGGYGKQADMWSLGVILYIMLSGIPPFEEEGLYEQILEGKYEFDVSEWSRVSPEAKELVTKLMTVDPKGRLNIQQATTHKWFDICLSPPTTPDQALNQKPEHSPPGAEASAAKRYKTMSDVRP